MGDRLASPDFSVAERLREAFEQAPRVAEPGIDIEMSDGVVVPNGTMTSPEQQDAAVAIVRGVLPRHRVRIETRVADLTEPIVSAHLP